MDVTVMLYVDRALIGQFNLNKLNYY